MSTVYVIGIKHLFDHKGNILNRWEYLHIDASSGGYCYWSENVEGAKYFCTVDELEKWLNGGRYSGYRVIFYGTDENEYDSGSLCVNEVVFQNPTVYFEKYLPFKEM